MTTPRLRLRFLFTSLLVLLTAAASHGKSCFQGTPAALPPTNLWGSLEPVGAVQDTTYYTGNQRIDSHTPVLSSVDVEASTLFATYFAGLMVYDLTSTPVPTAQQRLALKDGWNGGWGNGVVWPGLSEIDQYLYDVDAPAGDATALAIAGLSPVGLTLWNTTTKTSPRVVYQDAQGDTWMVHAATFGGRTYAFAAGAFTKPGLRVYDLTTAKAFPGACVEDTSTQNVCHVLLSTISPNGFQYLHGASYNNRYYVAATSGVASVSPGRLELWDVTTPASSARKLLATAQGIFAGVALWSDTTHLYLALRRESTIATYDVTGCLTTTCSALPTPLATVSVARVAESDNYKRLTFSRSGSTPMLYAGNLDLCHEGESGHTEYLIDVTNPAAPAEVIPHDSYGPLQTTDAGKLVDYWSWYYPDFVRGYSAVGGMNGKFSGTYFYRVAFTLLDVHQMIPITVGPTAGFRFTPSVVYVNDPVTFQDTSNPGN